MTDDDRPEALSVRSARRGDHVAELAWSGHGEPGTGWAECSCGWRGARHADSGDPETGAIHDDGRRAAWAELLAHLGGYDAAAHRDRIQRLGARLAYEWDDGTATELRAELDQWAAFAR